MGSKKIVKKKPAKKTKPCPPCLALHILAGMLLSREDASEFGFSLALKKFTGDLAKDTGVAVDLFEGNDGPTSIRIVARRLGSKK
jgi:hypothetical protein